MPPVKPMLAKSQPAIPEGMSYEPKFDGFRCIAFRDGDEIELGSRNERPLTRYFPEVADALLHQFPERCVVDGEIVVALDGELDFWSLQQRIHPAASRVQMLSRKTPAWFIAFDLLALDEASFMGSPFSERRRALEAAFRGVTTPVYVAPITDDIDLARRWFERFEGAGLDGIVAKPHDLRYVPNRRLWVKVKHERTADCVVAGFRWYRRDRVVGSLLLGLYDEDGDLHPIGVIGAFSALRRRQLLEEIAPYRVAEGESHPWTTNPEWQQGAGQPGSRWNSDKDLSFEPLRPVLVVEIAYDWMEGDRLRHTGQFRRWRPDRDPESCTFDQLDRPQRFDVGDVLSPPTGEP